MAQAITTKELTYRAETAVASQFGYKGRDALAHARILLAKEPQLWAQSIAEDELRADGFKITQNRKDAIWRALGGK